MEKVKPLVSISCCAYNQENYIRKALDGFIMQKTNFPFEVLVHDDASTDNTANIIREYEQKYPNIIKPIYQKENQYSKPGVKKPGAYNIERTIGKYYTICEGDDYWTDPFKLQRQVDFLENNPEYIAHTDNSKILYTETNEEKLFSTKPSRDITMEELLAVRPFTTASIMFRTSVINDLMKKVKIGDIGIWCFLKTKGKIYYNSENVSSVYRRGPHGVVMGTEKIEWAKKMESWNKNLEEITEGLVNKDIFIQRNFKEFFPLIEYYKNKKMYRNMLYSLYKSIIYSKGRRRQLIKYIFKLN